MDVIRRVFSFQAVFTRGLSLAGLILVVDDDPGTRGWVRAALELEDYAVAIAVDGDEALALVRAAEPALILLDVRLPVRSGAETLATLREHGFLGPVVFMSAGTISEAEALARGAAAYLPKPFDIDCLLAVVAQFAGPAA